MCRLRVRGVASRIRIVTLPRGPKDGEQTINRPSVPHLRPSVPQKQPNIQVWRVINCKLVSPPEGPWEVRVGSSRAQVAPE